MFDKYTTEKAKLVAPVDTSVADTLKERKDAKLRQQMEKARAKAKTTLAAKKEKDKVKF